MSRVWFRMNRLRLFVFFFAFSLMGSARAMDVQDGSSADTTRYSVEMSEEAKSKLMAALTMIKVGDSISRAKALMGRPTYEQDNIGKKGEFINRGLYYVVKSVDPRFSNIHDQVVTLFFDRSDRFIRAQSTVKN